LRPRVTLGGAGKAEDDPAPTTTMITRCRGQSRNIGSSTGMNGHLPGNEAERFLRPSVFIAAVASFWRGGVKKL
jgi:hypothetical protein